MKYPALIISPLFFTSVHAAELAVQLVDADNKPIENVVVYATPKTGIEGLPKNYKKLVVGQKDKKFSPYVTVMQTGQQITFSNQDDITHHVYSVSGNNRFDFKLKAGTTQTTKAMDSAEEVAMGCNIHDWMSGYVLVVDTPYYGNTNELGELSLTLDVMGEYEVTVWHPQLDTKANRFVQKFDLKTENAEIKLKLPKNLLPIPEQSGQDDFDFLDEY